MHIIITPQQRERITQIANHLCVIVMIFILPEAVVSSNDPRGPMLFVPYVKVSVFVAVFYLEYFLVRWRTSMSVKVAGSLVIALAGSAALYMLLFSQLPPRHEPHGNPALTPMAMRDFVMVSLIVGLSIAVALGERMRKAEMSRKAEELKQLKSQLNPHFLFNSLNTVYALTEVDPQGAREAVHNLSTLLRYALYEADAPMVKLKREINFITDYVSLMQARLCGSTTIDYTVDVSAQAATRLIAPMLFVVIVENAFKYGDKSYDKSYVTIHLTSSDNDGGWVDCVVENTFDPTDEHTKHGGVGLENLRRRLSLIYGAKASLHTESSNSVFKARLKIKLQ